MGGECVERSLDSSSRRCSSSESGTVPSPTQDPCWTPLRYFRRPTAATTRTKSATHKGIPKDKWGSFASPRVALPRGHRWTGQQPGTRSHQPGLTRGSGCGVPRSRRPGDDDARWQRPRTRGPITASAMVLAVMMRLPVVLRGDRSDTGARRQGSDERTNHVPEHTCRRHTACRLGGRHETDPCHGSMKRAACTELVPGQGLRKRRACPGQPASERWPPVSRCGPDTFSCQEQPCPAAARRGPCLIGRIPMVHGGRTRLGGASRRAAAARAS